MVTILVSISYLMGYNEVYMNESLRGRRLSTESVPEDYKETSFYRLLLGIPEELVTQHIAYIEQNDLNDNEAGEYLSLVIEKRHEALTETHISDVTLLEKIKDQLDDVLLQIETSVFNDTENFLGSGMTAKVKYFEVSDPKSEAVLPMAVKYLLTPTKMTLSASAEHDMLAEVERIQKIEALEEDAHLKHITVPHPYFHHKNEKMQCYGMQLIDGFDLSKELENMASGDVKVDLIQKLASIDVMEVEEEIKTFFNTMHTYCLHGDMKPANMMVDREGKFYVIDFGQSRLASDIPDKAQDQFYTLREDEIKTATLAVRKIISDARTLLAAR